MLGSEPALASQAIVAATRVAPSALICPVAWLSASTGAPSLVSGTALYWRSALTAVGDSGCGLYQEYQPCDSRTVAMTPAVIADAMLVPLRLRYCVPLASTRFCAKCENR